jgi:hypothetical protein
MDKRSYWPFSIKKIPPSFDMPKPFEIDPVMMKAIYGERFKGNLGDDPIANLKKFKKDVILLRLTLLATKELKLKYSLLSCC